jgi:hypothetical protein
MDSAKWTGPVAGLATLGASKLGVTLDPKAQRSQKAFKGLASDYIRDVSGLATTDKEHQRLLEQLPELTNDKQLNRIAYEEFKKVVQKTAAKLRAGSDRLNNVQPANQARSVDSLLGD